MAKISISEFKHNPTKKPFHILLAREDFTILCPVTVLVQYIRLRGDRQGPLFCHADFSPVSFHQFNTELQRCLTYCGLDISRYKSHSFRIGGKGSLMSKSVLLVAGNQVRLKFIYVRKFFLLTNGLGRKLQSFKGCVVYVTLIYLSSYAS